ncbi:MAG: sigma-70 family RNA polymerase sigma factor [Gaiellales bacterium]
MAGLGEPAFQEFYAAHRAVVLRLLVGMVGPVDAEDCFQETFLKVLRAWPPAERGANLDSWLLVIAHRTAIDLLRSRTRELPASTDVNELADMQALAAPRELEFADAPALWAAVRDLAPKQRAVVVLRIVLDRSHAQIAEVLDCSEAAARRSYADAIVALRTRATHGELEVE